MYCKRRRFLWVNILISCYHCACSSCLLACVYAEISDYTVLIQQMLTKHFWIKSIVYNWHSNIVFTLKLFSNFTSVLLLLILLLKKHSLWLYFLLVWRYEFRIYFYQINLVYNSRILSSHISVLIFILQCHLMRRTIVWIMCWRRYKLLLYILLEYNLLWIIISAEIWDLCNTFYTC